MTRSQVQVLNRPPEIIERPARDVFIFVIICHLLAYNAVGLSGASPRPPILLMPPSGVFLFTFHPACVIMQASKGNSVKMEDKNNMSKLRPNSCGGG